jgi:TolB-like protein/Tfp pilus assembly protein PilF
MSDIFVSYKAEDRNRVRPLVEALEADGLSVWWDAHIGGGDEWRETIARHLDDAKCVIVVWSKRSIGPDGRFVRDEAARAARRHAYLPVRIDKVDPPLGFGETQALPLNGWKGNRIDQRYLAVRNAARSMIGLEPDTGDHAHPSGVGRRPLLVGGAAAFVGAGIGGWLLLKPDEAKANSIAVLPFANLSGDPAQGYFSDGMAEELRSALSRIAGLQVVARTSSEMLRDADAKTAARKLGVEHVVSGSVRRSQSMIRVNAQLIDGTDGLERWSETFDRSAGDVLEIQSSIAQSVAQALSIRLAGKDREILTLGGTRNPAAQDLFFQARPERIADTETALRQGVALLDAAIALDPNFADAHATKAIRLSVLAGTYALSSAESHRGQALALASANQAISIAPQFARGYAARALIHVNQLDIGEALADLVKADALPGSEAETLRNYATVLDLSRRPEEALRMSARATKLDPLNPVSFETQAVALYHARRYADAVATARRSLQLSPERQRARSFLANALLALNKTAEADAEYRKLDPADYRRLLGQAVMAARAGDRAAAMTHLRAMQQRYGDSAHFQYGEIYAQLGSGDQAISELQSALAKRDPGMSRIGVDPFLDPLRRDPRFRAIESKLNFPRS